MPPDNHATVVSQGARSALDALTVLSTRDLVLTVFVTVFVALFSCFCLPSVAAADQRSSDFAMADTRTDPESTTVTATTDPITTGTAATDTTGAKPTGRMIIKYRQSDTTPGFITRSAGTFDRSKWRAKMGLLVTRNLSAQQELVRPYSASTMANTSDSDTAGIRETETRYLQSETLSRQLDRQFANSKGVAFVSPEYVRQPMVFPNDPLFEGTDGNLTQRNQSYLYDGTYSAHAPGAWDITTGSESSVIAIVDTGVINTHPELIERSVPGVGFDFVSANSPGDFTNANDGDGRDSDPTDPGDHCLNLASSWHGTEVASVAAGQSNDGQGIAGIDWNARILHARALGRCGGTDADIIDAVRWSAGIEVPGLPENPSPAQVVNLSIGGATECTRAWQDVIDELNQRNVSVIIAAGNESQNALRSAPANCANVITVGASTADGEIDAFFSNYGLKVTIAAPGRDILLASNTGFTDLEEDGNTYLTESGSSLSAAIISGTVSLLRSLNAALTSDQIRAVLQHSATPFDESGSCGQYYCGSGIVNLARALTMARDNSYDPDRDLAKQTIEAQASTLPLNQATESGLFGYRDIRYYEIDVPNNGMLTVSSSSEINLYAYLLDSRYSVLAIDDDSGGNRQFRVAHAVTAGRYYVAVERNRHRLNDGESTFTLYADLGTDQPTPFVFSNVDNALANSTVNSNTIEISGLATPALMTISGGFYSLNGANLTAQPTEVRNGDQVLVALRTSGVGQSTTEAVLAVGAYTTSFEVTTGDQPVKTIRTVKSTGGCTVSPSGADYSMLYLMALIVTSLTTRKRRRTRNST